MPLIDLSKLTPSLFPTAEDDSFEFKSSLMLSGEINRELNHAASAFANTGGGCFIWGVADETGDPDGGISPLVGKQEIQAWIDKVIHNVSPPPKYDIQIYSDNEGRGRLDADKVVAAVSIHPSAAGPHMAHDNRYYIRAGRHTLPANHALVEALWARRQVSTPMLKLVLVVTSAEGLMSSVDLGIVNMTNAPAVNVELDIHPKHGHASETSEFYPIRVPLVEKSMPYYMHLTYISALLKIFQPGVLITVKYEDVAGNQFSVSGDASLIESFSPSDRQWVDYR